MSNRVGRWLGGLAAAAALLISAACGISEPSQEEDKYAAVPRACELLDKTDIQAVIGAGLHEASRDPETYSTKRMDANNCWWRFMRSDDADESAPYVREVQIRLALYTSHRNKPGTHWAKIGYQQRRDLFETVNPTPVEALGDEAASWYERSLFVGAHTLFRDGNLVVTVNYGGSDPLTSAEAKQGAVRLARVVEKNL